MSHPTLTATVSTRRGFFTLAVAAGLADHVGANRIARGLRWLACRRVEVRA